MRPLRYRRRWLAWSISAGFGLFLLIGISGLITQRVGGVGFLFSAAVTVLATVLIIRSFRMATIIANGDTLEIRGFSKSTRVPVSMIRIVETLERPNMYGLIGKTIAVRTTHGSSITASEFWTRSSRSGTNRMDTVARELNEWCRARRSVT